MFEGEINREANLPHRFLEEAIRFGTINGISLVDLERSMRPGTLARSGFLNSTERLIDVLLRDHQTVEKVGLTHAQLAEPLFLAMEHRFPFVFNEIRYGVEFENYRGYQESPFNLRITSGTDYTVIDPQENRLTFSGLLPGMIRTYGFYEGEVPYRISPQKIIDFFSLRKRDL